MLQIAAVISIACIFPAASQNIVINEVLASNTSTNMDEDASYQDWIELYNTGLSPINLQGYGLTDDSTVLFKWVFPNVTINPGSYLLIWASDKNRTNPNNPLHTNFKISGDGETISLTEPLGSVIDLAPAVSMLANVSFGRLPNGTGNFVFFQPPTPNAENNGTGYSDTLSPPQFSQNSGFFTSAFDLTISSSEPGTTIIYTLDGSEPDENNLGGTTYNYKNQYPKLPGQPFGDFLFNTFQTLHYSAPIPIIDRALAPNKVSIISTTFDFTPPYFPNGPIYKGNVVRAKVIKPGALPSKVVSKNYFVTPQGASKYSLPVLSFSFDENDLYDYEDGISVAGIDFDNWRIANPTKIPSRQIGNYERSGIENERKANMHYFVNGVEKINQDVGIRVRGAYSRLYPSKSWNIAARSDYGDDNLSYKFFADEPYTSFERLSAKTGGSDFYNTMFRDALNHQLVKDLRMETESFQPMVVFMNGEYWGLLNMREKYDNNYFKQVYNIDDVDLLENQGAIQEGDAVDYTNMFNYIQNNSFVDPANYAYIQTRMDTDNFMDYFIANIYCQNDDWPGNNIIYWRKRTTGFVPNAPYGHDGRWRWAIHDMDSTLDEYDENTLEVATSTNGVSPNPPWSTLILRKLLENPTFKNDFISRFADLMNTNYLSSRVIAKIDEIAAIIAPEMNDQYFRWKAPLNNGDWQYHINEEKTFVNLRPNHQREHIRSKFGITNNINATLSVSNADHGYIKINTITIVNGTPGINSNPYPWTGIYFSNIPIKLKAIAKEGYVFSHWEGVSTSTEEEIIVDSAINFSVTAIFVPEGFAVELVEPIYFWLMNSALPNDTPITNINSTFEVFNDGILAYQSCLEGYPFANGHPNWRKASLERRNSPTNINYIPSANGNIPFSTSIMRGIQVKQPFQNNGLENALLFNFSTVGYKNIVFGFAAKNEDAADAIIVDYSVSAGNPVWLTTDLSSISLSLSSEFQLFEVDFSAIINANNNPNFKIRLRFTGSNMTVDNGDRVTFNNFSVKGVQLPLQYNTPNVFTIGTTITALSPTVVANVDSYSIVPSLPNGLSFDESTGIISGTPTELSPATDYEVTATNSGGSTSFTLSIEIIDSAPTN
ncbi:MAG TPA: CotH kinase family protein, partial [Flavobacterium sp.]|nr:CotH kinase family protein [Flavobacterium sp.]